MEISDQFVSEGVPHAVGAWLAAKRARTGSARTVAAYAATLDTFRRYLRERGLDLDGDPRRVALALATWAGRDHPAPTTYNHRVSCMRSFYSFAVRHGFFDANPADLVERRPVVDYAHARALDPATIRARLAAIDRTTREGARDYALIAVGLATGRRLSEIAALRWRHVTVNGETVIIEFVRTKGGKTARDALPPGTGAILLYHRHLWYGSTPPVPNAPLWGHLSNPSRPLTPRRLQDIVRARLGTHFHALRHIFARAMDHSGAPVTVIQARLGHASLATTTRYLAALRREENPYGQAVERLFFSDTG